MTNKNKNRILKVFLKYETLYIDASENLEAAYLEAFRYLNINKSYLNLSNKEYWKNFEKLNHQIVREIDRIIETKIICLGGSKEIENILYPIVYKAKTTDQAVKDLLAEKINRLDQLVEYKYQIELYKKALKKDAKAAMELVQARFHYEYERVEEDYLIVPKTFNKKGA